MLYAFKRTIKIQNLKIKVSGGQYFHFCIIFIFFIINILLFSKYESNMSPQFRKPKISKGTEIAKIK